MRWQNKRVNVSLRSRLSRLVAEKLRMCGLVPRSKEHNMRWDYTILRSYRQAGPTLSSILPQSWARLGRIGRIFAACGDGKMEKIKLPDSDETNESFMAAQCMSTTPKRTSGFSFCIITNGKRPKKLRQAIESIRALNIPTYEILVGGDVPRGLEEVSIVPLPQAARAGRLGEMRNRLIERARFDHLIVVDDDVLFQPDFYQGLLTYGEDYEVLCVRFLNPDGTRFWDWATYHGPGKQYLLEYTERDPFVFVTGGLCIMKATVADRVKWDEQRGFYQGEDVEFSRHLHAAGIPICFNCHSTVIHNDRRYTQCGKTMIRQDFFPGVELRWKRFARAILSIVNRH